VEILQLEGKRKTHGEPKELQKAEVQRHTHREEVRLSAWLAFSGGRNKEAPDCTEPQFRVRPCGPRLIQGKSGLSGREKGTQKLGGATKGRGLEAHALVHTERTDC
jgi:hypothetical protein